MGASLLRFAGRACGTALVVVLVVGQGGCGLVGGCELSAHSAIGATVVDAKTGARLCDATVTLQQSGHADEQASGVYVDDLAQCSYMGAFERTGDFNVIATKPGYSPASQAVTVTMGECHVNPQSVTLKVSPTS